MSYFSLSIVSKVDTKKLDSIIDKLGTTEQILNEVADQVVSDIKNNIQVAGVVDTGALLDSIKQKTEGNTSTIQDGVEYGFYNEFGTYRMAARPFFVPGVEKWAKNISGSLRRIFT